MEAEECYVGILTGTECHLRTYSKIVGIESMLDLPPETREVLMWRTGITLLNVDPSICFHHKYVHLNRFSSQQRFCCDPYKIHKSTCKGIDC